MEALAAFEEEAPNLVLMDLAMPVMDDIEAARAEIVAGTASLDPATHAAVLDAGVDTVVVTPVVKGNLDP